MRRAACVLQRACGREGEGRPLHAALARAALSQSVRQDGGVHAARLSAQRVRGRLASALSRMFDVLARHRVGRQVPLHRPTRRAGAHLFPRCPPHDPRRRPHAGCRPPADGASGREADARAGHGGPPRRRLARGREALSRLGRHGVLQGPAQWQVGSASS